MILISLHKEDLLWLMLSQVMLFITCDSNKSDGKKIKINNNKTF